MVGHRLMCGTTIMKLIRNSIPGPPPTVSQPGSSCGAGAPSDAVQDGIMVMPNGLLRIFWPSDSPKDRGQGTILGWRNSNLDIFVVSIQTGVEVSGHPTPSTPRD